MRMKAVALPLAIGVAFTVVAAGDGLQPPAAAPVMDFATYFGGSCCNNDWVNAVAVDQEGYIYLTGHAGSRDFPTKNAQNTACALGSLGSCNDAFIAKLDPSGQQLIYSTYFGSPSSDEGTAIAVDNQGRAVVAGTYANNQTFILLLDRYGQTIRSRYLFGSSSTGTNLTIPWAVAFDPDGNVLVAGETLSDRLTLARPVQAQAGAPSCQVVGGSTPVRYIVDAWVAKFSGDDYLILDFLTYLGGGGNDRATAIATDAAGNIYVAGETSSRDFPLVNAYQHQNRSTMDGHPTNCTATELFLAKIDPAAPRILYSTYLGASGLDLGARLAVDPAGYAYLVGYSSSTDWTVPGLAGNAGPYFMIKVGPEGHVRRAQWTGSLGGGSGAPPAGVALEPAGQAWTGLRTIEGIAPGGSRETWGGPGALINGIATGPGGALIVAGVAGGSNGLIQTLRAIQPNNAGGWQGALNGFVASYSPDPQAACDLSYAVNAASYHGPEAAASSIVSLFGCEFTSTSEAALGVPLPDTLAGVQVHITRDTRVAAPLYYVSPAQINFVVPEGLGPGVYKVVVRREGAVVATGALALETVAPALFTASGSGAGAPAAWVVRVAADGKQTFLPAADCSSGTCQPAWIDPPSKRERVILALYGTGLQGRSSMDQVAATVGGKRMPVLATLPQSEYPGLDQVNVELTPDIAGAGLVDLFLTADGIHSNRVKLRIR